MARHDRSLDILFQALSDPTRRALIARLMRGPASVSDLAQPLAMALPTVLAHLGKLEQGGLIHTEKRGRTRICRADPAALAPARHWIDRQQAIWEARLDRLEDHLARLQNDPPKDYDPS